jgi:predicted porin
MRIPLLVLAATAAAPAFAQGNVTLSGILDLAARSVSNEGVGSMRSLVSGSNATSRITISGREDLGGGLAAGFHLEHGLAADTGAAASSSKFWDRRTTVSLLAKDWGELRLGRDFVPSYSAWSRHDPFAYVGVARSANFVSASPTGPIRSAFGSNANTTVRSDNAVQWLLPAWLPGLEGGLMVAAGEGGAVASGQAKVIGLRLGWTTTGFGLTAATTSSENSQTGGAKFKDTVVGAQAEWSPVKLAAAWRRFEQADATQTLTLLAASSTFGMHEFKGSWIRSDLGGTVGSTTIGGNDATQLGLGYVYTLSKRSALYASWARISNDGAARFVIPDGAAGLVAGGRSSGYEAGIRHRF